MLTKNLPYKFISICPLILFVALAGCGGYLDLDNSAPSPESPTETTTDTQNRMTETSSDTPEPTQTPTNTPDFTQEEKYGYFRDGYVEGLQDGGVRIINDTIDGKNESLHITYQMRDPKKDKYVGWERENITFGYVATVDFYLNGNVSELDSSWVPKQVNVTAVTPEGEQYETAYTTFERPKQMIDGDISERRYLLEYYGTIEPGPANSEYEE